MYDTLIKACRIGTVYVSDAELPTLLQLLMLLPVQDAAVEAVRSLQVGEGVQGPPAGVGGRGVGASLITVSAAAAGAGPRPFCGVRGG